VLRISEISVSLINLIGNFLFFVHQDARFDLVDGDIRVQLLDLFLFPAIGTARKTRSKPLKNRQNTTKMSKIVINPAYFAGFEPAPKIISSRTFTVSRINV
jgi:hypothetical protein